MKIEEIDRNLKVENALGRDDIVFMDAKCEPFRIYGLYDYKNQPRYIRLPAEVAEKTSPLVNELAYNTSGGRVRFATDSPFIAIRCKMPKITHDPGMALTGTSGFDLYVHRDDGHDTYHHTFVPPFDMKDGYESLQGGFDDGKMHTYTIHFPLYNDVDSLEIGLQAGAHLEAGAEYRPIAPIVYYGSSITQGGDVSRPGNSYQNIIAQRNNVDYINLGFSGACKAEDSMIEYLSTLDMSIFVMDYDHNAPNPDHLRATHKKLFRAVRDRHPDLPIIMISKPNAKNGPEDIERRSIIYDTYYEAYSAGDHNVFFIDGYSFFMPEYHDYCTDDGCHPTDFGMLCMAKTIGYAVNRILRGDLW